MPRPARARPADGQPGGAQPLQELGRLVEHECDQDQDPDRHLGVLGRLVEQRQDVVDQRQEQRCQQRPEERPAPAGEAGASEHAGGDALERVVPDDRRSDLDLRGEVEARDRREHRAADEGEDHRAVCPDPDPARRRLVETDRPQRHARPGAVQPPVSRDREDDHPDEREGDEAPARRQRLHRVARDRPRRVVAQPERHALEDAERPERGDDRRKAEDPDQERVEDPGGEPHADQGEGARDERQRSTSRASSCTRRRRRTGSSGRRPTRRSRPRAARMSGRSRQARAASSRAAGCGGCSSTRNASWRSGRVRADRDDQRPHQDERDTPRNLIPETAAATRAPDVIPALRLPRTEASRRACADDRLDDPPLAELLAADLVDDLPRDITTTRSHSPASSSGSLDLTTIAMPSLRLRAQGVVDVEPGRDVHALRRLLGQDHFDVPRRNGRVSETFCWLPPESDWTGCSIDAIRMFRRPR